MAAEKWIPEVGALTVRHRFGPAVNNILLFYRSDPDREADIICLAEMRDFVTRGSVGQSTETSLAAFEYLPEMQISIVRRPVTDSDLWAFCRLWDRTSKFLLDTWLSDIVMQSELTEEEKTRLSNIALFGHREGPR